MLFLREREIGILFIDSINPKNYFNEDCKKKIEPQKLFTIKFSHKKVNVSSFIFGKFFFKL